MAMENDGSSSFRKTADGRTHDACANQDDVRFGAHAAVSFRV
jgi:hypothetical protein